MVVSGVVVVVSVVEGLVVCVSVVEIVVGMTNYSSPPQPCRQC